MTSFKISVMNISCLNNYFNFNINKIENTQSRNKMAFSSLAPLKKDTVSFSGKAKLEGEYMVYAPTKAKCEEVNENANPAKFKLDKILKEYIMPINKNSDDKTNAFDIKTRVKSASSIREKVVAKFGDINKEEKREFAKTATQEILNYYEPVKNIHKDNVLVTAGQLLEYENEFKGIPPYKNEEEFTKYLITYLNLYDVIRFKPPYPMTEFQAFEKIAKKMKLRSNPRHCYANRALYINTKSTDGIKHYVNDVVGARIILNDNNKKTVQKILNGLKRASYDGKLKILSVENNLPALEKLRNNQKVSSFEYISSSRLSDFADKTDAEYIKKKSKSGYLAIHINVDLSGNDISLNYQDNKFNGYKGEIQIMDANIELLKDVEDLCYKIKDNKSSFDVKKYKNFRNYFNKYYNDKIKENFEAYTYDLYINQREKLSNNEISKNKAFSSINDLGYQGRIPNELDYNNLRKIKEICEQDYDKKMKKVMTENVKASTQQQIEMDDILFNFRKQHAICKKS